MKKKSDDLLVRIDERVLSIQDTMKEFVTRSEFTPVKVLVYGFAGLVLTSIVIALTSVVVKAGML